MEALGSRIPLLFRKTCTLVNRILVQRRITSCRACRLSKIYGPFDCIATAKDSVKPRGMNKKKHKTVFADFKGVNIHEQRKEAVVLMNFFGSHFIT